MRVVKAVLLGVGMVVGALVLAAATVLLAVTLGVLVGEYSQ